MKRIALMLVMTLLLVGCGSSLDREKLKDDVMAVHDEVMQEWFELKKMRKQVVAKIILLEESDSTGTDVAELKTLSSEMGAAYDLMSTWMKDWGVNAKPYETGGSASDEDALKFFQSEQERVNEMEKKIMKAYSAAKEALK